MDAINSDKLLILLDFVSCTIDIVVHRVVGVYFIAFTIEKLDHSRARPLDFSDGSPRVKVYCLLVVLLDALSFKNWGRGIVCQYATNR